jgi:hypothetical protein
MQTFILWAIYIILFVVIFAIIAAATRSFVGIAWGFLIAAVVALIVTAAVGGCTCYGEPEFLTSGGITCLGAIMILMVIVGIILVVVAYIYKWRSNKNKCVTEDPCAVKDGSINEELANHPSYGDECEYVYEDDDAVVDSYKRKSVQKSKLDCTREKGCKESGSFTVAERIRKRSRAAL